MMNKYLMNNYTTSRSVRAFLLTVRVLDVPFYVCCTGSIHVLFYTLFCLLIVKSLSLCSSIGMQQQQQQKQQQKKTF